MKFYFCAPGVNTCLVYKFHANRSIFTFFRITTLFLLRHALSECYSSNQHEKVKVHLRVHYLSCVKISSKSVQYFLRKTQTNIHTNTQTNKQKSKNRGPLFFERSNNKKNKAQPEKCEQWVKKEERNVRDSRRERNYQN